MTGEISTAEVAYSIQVPHIAGFNLSQYVVSAEVGPGGIVIVQTKANESDKKAAHAQNNRGNEKFVNKHQKKVPIGSHSRLPDIARNALAGNQQFGRFYARHAPTLSRKPQMMPNGFDRNREKLWVAKDQAIARFSLTGQLTSSFACLSQSTRDRFTERAILNGARTTPDGKFIERRQPQQAGASNGTMPPAPQPTPKVGMDRRQSPRGMATTPGGIQANSLQAALDRWGRSGVPLLGYDSSLSMRRS